MIQTAHLYEQKPDFSADNQGNIPFIEKFMVPQMYELFKFGGSTIRDDERGIRRMLRYFSDFFTEDQLRKNMARYNLQTMISFSSGNFDSIRMFRLFRKSTIV